MPLLHQRCLVAFGGDGLSFDVSARFERSPPIGRFDCLNP